MKTLQDMLIHGYELLKASNIDTYKLDCQLLLMYVLKKDKMFILMNRDFKVEEKQAEEYYRLLKLRANYMPIKYILQECEFMGLNFKIKEGVLIPRPDTEVLVESAIEDIKNKEFTKICDVCCGSGIIGITTAYYLNNVFVDSYDISDTAIEVTKNNIEEFNLNDRVKVYKSDLLEFAINNNKTYEAILSNPPYIKEDVIPTLMRDVKDYEPYEALSGGEDGLYFYRKIVKQSKKLLVPGGIIAFEIGHDQKESVSTILKEDGFGNIECIKDLANLNRVVKATKNVA